MNIYKYTFVNRHGLIAEQEAETLTEAMEKQRKASTVQYKVIHEFYHMAVLQCVTKPEYTLGVTWKEAKP